MCDGINAVLESARLTLVERWRIADPDLVADVLSRVWYRVAVQGIRPGVTVLWYSLCEERNGRPFPGTPSKTGRQDALRRARRGIKDIGQSRRFLDPAKAAQIAEEVQLVHQECRKGSERAVVSMILLEQTLMEASQAYGYHYVTLGRAKSALAARCRAKRRALR